METCQSWRLHAREQSGTHPGPRPTLRPGCCIRTRRRSLRLPHITDGRLVDVLEPDPFSFAGPYGALGAIIEIWAALPWELALQSSQKLDFCAETFDFAELVKSQRQ